MTANTSRLALSERWQTLCKMRQQYGFKGTEKLASWSKRFLASGQAGLPMQMTEVGRWCSDEGTYDWVPQNDSLYSALKEKFVHLGFDYKLREFSITRKDGTLRKKHTVDFINYPTIEGVMLTLGDLWIVPVDLVDKPIEGSDLLAREKIGDSTEYVSRYFGSLVVNTAEKIEFVTNAREIEELLNTKYLPAAMRCYAGYSVPNFWMSHMGAPAIVVRLDMAPRNGVYEVEANVAGLGITHSLGIPLANEVRLALIEADIPEVGYGVAHSRLNQREDQYIFMKALSELGVKTYEMPVITLQTVGNMALWIRAGEEDLGSIAPVMRNCVLLHYHGGGHKGYLAELDGTKLLADFLVTGAEECFSYFPDGFTLKPFGGWGTRGVNSWVPHQPWKELGSTKTWMHERITRLLREGLGYDYIVQPFHAPDVADDGSFMIWRLYAVWRGGRGGYYRVVGGCWSKRRSLRNHGASDTIIGPLVVKR